MLSLRSDLCASRMVLDSVRRSTSCLGRSTRSLSLLSLAVTVFQGGSRLVLDVQQSNPTSRYCLHGHCHRPLRLLIHRLILAHQDVYWCTVSWNLNTLKPKDESVIPQGSITATLQLDHYAMLPRSITNIISLTKTRGITEVIPVVIFAAGYYLQ